MHWLTWLTWALFGNDLDGVDASSPQAAQWRPTLTGWRRRVLWWLRNPFHNLLWHVLGVVDQQTQQLGAGWVRHALTGGNPQSNWDGGLHVCVLRKPRRVPLPFVSFRAGQFEGYLGWRERGNLGGALRPAWPLALLVLAVLVWGWLA